MFDLFYMGGPLFMGILTLILIVILSLGVYSFFVPNEELQTRRPPELIRSVGLFALMVGILGQLIGLFQAFQAIEQVGQVSPGMLAGGLKVSMVTTLYGAIIFVVAYLLSFALQAYKR